MGATPSDQDIKAVAGALATLVREAGGVQYLNKPPGYEHLGLAILDSLLSLRLVYSSVEDRLQKYCGYVEGLDWDNLTDRDPEHDAQRLVETLQSLSADEQFEVFGNLKTLEGRYRPGRPRIEQVLEVAAVLLDESPPIQRRSDLLKVHQDFPGIVERKLTRVRGVGPAAAKYILNLCGAQAVKPDTMVVRWVERVLDGTSSYSQYEIGELFESAVQSLEGEFTPQLEVRVADHLVWRKESGRSISITDETDG